MDDNLTVYDQIHKIGGKDVYAPSEFRDRENARNIERTRIAAEKNADSTDHIESTVSDIDGRIHALNTRVSELQSDLEQERNRAEKSERTATIISIISIIIAVFAIAVDVFC